MSMAYRLRCLEEDGEVLEPVARMPFELGLRHDDLDTGSDSEVQQQFVEECDINNIMKRYRLTGVLPTRDGEPFFGDFTGVADYQSALNAVIAADEAFAALPSDLRTRFDNDPAKFVAFVEDAANSEELVSLGLTKPKTISDVDRLIAAVEAGPKAPAEAAPSAGDSPSK